MAGAEYRKHTRRGRASLEQTAAGVILAGWQSNLVWMMAARIRTTGSPIDD